MPNPVTEAQQLLHQAWQQAGLGADKLAALTQGASLYGNCGLLDSIGVVSLVAALAERLEAQYGIGESVLDRMDAALLARFASGASLLDWLEELLGRPPRA
jgi:hypothetical protein